MSWAWAEIGRVTAMLSRRLVLLPRLLVSFVLRCDIDMKLSKAQGLCRAHSFATVSIVGNTVFRF